MADLATYSIDYFYEEAKRALLRLTEVESDEAIWTILLAEILWLKEKQIKRYRFCMILLKQIQTTRVLVVQSEAYREEETFDLAEKNS